MKPVEHAQRSVKRHGGLIEDYLEIHTFLDSTKGHVPDMRHRAILHNSWGCFLVEKIYGAYLTNADGKIVATRDIAEEHIIEDMGTIPTVQDYLSHLPMLPWLGGTPKSRRTISYEEVD